MPTESESSTIECGYYLVALLDILGQSQKLRRLTELPEGGAPDARTTELLRGTVGEVLTLRDHFTRILESKEVEPDAAALLPDPLRAELRSLMQRRVLPFWFSDTMVVAVPLKAAVGDPPPINGVWHTIFSACVVVISSLGCGYALRGGIDVGIAARIGDREIYGAALETVHALERYEARYPRILVGQELVTYLEIAARQDRDSIAGRIAAERADSALRLIFTDNDGRVALDYLGDEFRMIAGDGEFVDAIREAYAFVCQERNRFKNDEKLRGRYEELYGYFRSHIGAWGIEP